MTGGRSEKLFEPENDDETDIEALDNLLVGYDEKGEKKIHEVNEFVDQEFSRQT
jgi:hypothetical protein